MRFRRAHANEPRPMTPLYVCHGCLKPIEPDAADGCIHYEGITDESDRWVWGPVAVHEEPCRMGVRTPFDEIVLERGWMYGWARRSAMVTTGIPVLNGKTLRIGRP